MIMKKFFWVFIILLSIVSCSKKDVNNTTISGDIRGLKKGTLYLEKINDSILVTLDSIVMNGNSSFTFQINLESPEILYLFLRKTEGTQVEDGIEFFAEPGTITINTTLNNFESQAQVTGSVNHEKYIEYQNLMQRFNDRKLELFAENIEAQRDGNLKRIEELNKSYESVIRSSYLATINFALNNKDYEIAPYLALREIFDANINYLDTIYNVLSPTVKKSSYGKQLENYINERKAIEINQ